MDELDYQPREDMSDREIREKFSQKVIKVIKEGQENGKNYLVVCMFAGHGILKDGMQTLVLNEFDRKTQFYQLFKAEDLIRQVASVYSKNSYFIAIFACCRELYKAEIHSGCVLDPKLEETPTKLLDS